MANIASGTVEVITTNKKLIKDLENRIKDGPFHYASDADVEIGDNYIFCGFTGRWSCEDAWDFFRNLLDDESYELRSALIESEISGQGYEEGAREASQIKKSPGEDQLNWTDISDQWEWEEDEEEDWSENEEQEITVITNKEEALEAANQYDYDIMQKISDELKDDKEVVMAAFESTGSDIFEHASQNLRADTVFIKSLMEIDPNVLIYASEKIRDDKDLVMTSLKQGGEYVFEYMSDELKADKEVVLTALELFKIGSWTFSGVSDELKADKEVMMAAVQSEPLTLEFASDELKADTDIINAIIPDDIEGIYDESGNRSHFGDFFEFVSDEFKSNRDLVLSIVKKDGRALEFASEELRKDREVVIEAAANNRNSLEHAEKSLQNDPEVLSQIKKKVLETVENLCSFQCRCLDLQYLGDQKGKYGWDVDDEQVMLAAIRSHGDAVGSGPLSYASDRLKDDREIVIAAVRKKGQWALNSASERLKNDPDVIAASKLAK